VQPNQVEQVAVEVMVTAETVQEMIPLMEDQSASGTESEDEEVYVDLAFAEAVDWMAEWMSCNGIPLEQTMEEETETPQGDPPNGIEDVIPPDSTAQEVVETPLLADPPNDANS
jgi:hypothetical protein